ncbi:MAG: ATP-grasp domain-containing protein [Lachnospiraceae bacterium]|nr:ATP-grasp domain-containing protein [Lachnospiraceae bacterium]
MGRVWLKTRFDSGMNIEVPHSCNISNAMYGFRELGAEIIPYHTIDEIYDKVSEEDIVLDYIDQCNKIFKKFGKEPHIDDYPANFERFLGRKVWIDTIDSISTHEEKWSAGYFVKPVRSKAFTGKIISGINDLIGCGNCYENYEVLVSEALNIKAEWRCFIMYDEMIDVRPYGLLLDPERKSFLYHYDENVLQDMLNEFKNIENRPAACSMDICVTAEGKTLLMEFNDAYALGHYGLAPILYAKLISARWSQILERPDEYKF